MTSLLVILFWPFKFLSSEKLQKTGSGGAAGRAESREPTDSRSCEGCRGEWESSAWAEQRSVNAAFPSLRRRAREAAADDGNRQAEANGDADRETEGRREEQTVR